jgi:hypothetical protein
LLRIIRTALLIVNTYKTLNLLEIKVLIPSRKGR